MSKNPISGIEDEKEIRDKLLKVGVRGLKRIAGYKPKVLDENETKPIIARHFRRSKYDSDYEGAKVVISTDMCWRCAEHTNCMLNNYYGDYFLNPYFFTESRADYLCSVCGEKVTEIPF